MARLSSNDDKDNHIVFANEGMHHQFRLLLSLFSRHNNKEERVEFGRGIENPSGRGAQCCSVVTTYTQIYMKMTMFSFDICISCVVLTEIFRKERCCCTVNCKLVTLKKLQFFFYDWIFFNPGKFKKKRLPENIPFYFSASEEVFTFDKHADKNFK